MNVVVCFEEDCTQTRLSDRVVFEVEFVETMERVGVSVHIKCVDREVVCSQVNTFKNLSQSQMLAVTVKDNLVRALLHLALDETQQVLLVHTG